MCTKVF
jgi:hypothetical protein